MTLEITAKPFKKKKHMNFLGISFTKILVSWGFHENINDIVLLIYIYISYIYTHYIYIIYISFHGDIMEVSPSFPWIMGSWGLGDDFTDAGDDWT